MSNPDPDRIDDRALWRSVSATLREVLAPALHAGYELDTARQLQGLARYAAGRAGEDVAHRMHVLTRALGAVGPVPHLPSALAQASDVLVHAVRFPTDRAAVARARGVRAALLQLLDEDVATAAPLLETFSGHALSDELPADREVPAYEREALTSWFEEALDGPVELTRAVVMSGGHSRRMLRVELAGPQGAEQFVVRIEQGGTFGTDGTVEARAMQALRAAGIPVAPVRWVESGHGLLGQPFFVMDLVPGASTVDDAVLETFLRRLGDVHRTDPAVLTAALGPPPAPEDAVLAQVDRWARIYRDSALAPVPLLDEAAAWLSCHLTPTGPTAVVHGDPGPGNFLHTDGVITALTDWEFVHYGDPAEDWSYFVTIRSRKLKSRQQWHDDLERVVGVHHDEATWHAWEVFNQFKGACANLTALRLFREGTATTPNLLAIGTAVHYRFLRRLAELIAERPCRLLPTA